jgi:hypothetical protein
MRGGSWLLALVGASTINASILERNGPAVSGLGVEQRRVVNSAQSHRWSNWLEFLRFGNYV